MYLKACLTLNSPLFTSWPLYTCTSLYRQYGN